jgi:gliding motility-associated-like protein
MNQISSHFFLLVLFISAWLNVLHAQAPNDNCTDAIVLSNVSNWCSPSAAYNNIGATGSLTTLPTCMPNSTNDVWFSFIAVATTVNIAVIGNTGNTPGGTLRRPQFALFSGSCGASLTSIACASDGFGNNVVESFAGPLIVGQRYYLMVGARDGNTGTFQICINNYNAVPDPNGDCPTGVILCDKSSFTVRRLVGTGNLKNEFSSSICIQEEFASAWYRWTCKDAGSLSFVITPTNPSDDIDFAVFELPGGINDCGNKVKIRCAAGGENVGQPFATWAACTGPTGLRLGETDNDEMPGCAAGQNNYVAAINMQAGKSYALIINNFSNTGNGFSIQFGGSGTFQGPAADFSSVPQLICADGEITFTDLSTSTEGIKNWDWSFGVDAKPGVLNGKGPHKVAYNSEGLKSVALTITSNSGCIVTKIKQVEVQSLPSVSADIHPDYCGANVNNGIISVKPSGSAQPYQYDWGAVGNFTKDTVRRNLIFGDYKLVVKDANGCRRLYDLKVPEGLSLEAGLDPVKPPTCFGDSDGRISISIAVGNSPILYDFGRGLQRDSVLPNIKAGTYQAYVLDAGGCEGRFTITVNDFPPLLTGIDPIDISCKGLKDGKITVIPSGGAGSFRYQWSNGDTSAVTGKLAAGQYQVTVTDANGCKKILNSEIIEPEGITATLDNTDVLCYGDSSGVIVVNAKGGTPPYQFSADSLAYQTSRTLRNLWAGPHTVHVKDSRGCNYQLFTSLTEPPPLIVDAGEDQTLDLGYTAKLFGSYFNGKSPVKLSWSPSGTLSCKNCDSPVAKPFANTVYYLIATDVTNCISIDSVMLFVNVIRPVYIPNAFSPNSDGLNDIFTIYGSPAVQLVNSLKIFNRWGGLVFEAHDFSVNDKSIGWDGTFQGKKLNPGVFAYFAEVEYIDGVKILYEGDLTLVR